MQLFNQINARKLEAKELNVFKDFFNNFLFLFVFVLTFVIQVAMVQFGGKAVQTAKLTLSENLICLGLGAIELIWGLLLKSVPIDYFNRFCSSEDPN
mmetsp:Transcript_27324/g.41550  ORF Transcript_27324/g.41550 Transcript_27324/m.41550 type:complete len:97 (+) Transcript_27324:1416-1706(+)